MVLVGIPPIVANATNNVAMWVGTLGSAHGYREEILAHRRLVAYALPAALVGSVIGAVLLLRTPPHLFERLIPWLLLAATAAFVAGPRLVRLRGGAAQPSPLTAWQIALQVAIAIYGGYFGAGIGLMTLAVLAFSGLRTMNEMNGVKNILTTAITGIAVIPFALAGVVRWPVAAAMAAAAMLGGYAGARFFRLLPSRLVRWSVIAIGLAMTTYFFVRPS
jgi:uncharacterized membrane protein YfcA